MSNLAPLLNQNFQVFKKLEKKLDKKIFFLIIFRFSTNFFTNIVFQLAYLSMSVKYTNFPVFCLAPFITSRREKTKYCEKMLLHFYKTLV